MNRTLTRAIALALLIAAVASSSKLARADGGLVRFSETVGPYRVTLFTSPAVPRAGNLDASVLVQRADTLEVVEDATVSFELVREGAKPGTRGTRYLASRDAATNKLLQAALLPLPAAGQWTINVVVEGPTGRAQRACEIEVGPPLPQYSAMLPWILFPVLPIALFALRESGRRARQ